MANYTRIEVANVMKQTGLVPLFYNDDIETSKKVVKANETLSFEAREGETLAIVGESGCGKSTLAKVLMGLETATDGAVLKCFRCSNMQVSTRRAVG